MITNSFGPEVPEGNCRAFVGRGRELTILTAEVEQALGGVGGAILLSGEPGIGKTRTAEELGAVARRNGSWVFSSRGWEGEGAPAFWPWVQIVRELLREESAESLMARIDPSGRDIVQLMPDLRDLVQKSVDLPPTRDHLETDEIRFRVFDGIVRLIKKASECRALTLILDDLHCADAPSLVLLEYLSREIRGSPLLVIATYRETKVDIGHPLSRSIAALMRYTFGRQITLQGLGKSDVATFLGLATSRDVSPALVSAVYDKTEGNPFFVAELAKLLATEGHLNVEGSGSVAGAIEIPATVKDVIRRRLGCLSVHAQAVLSVASVAGREFEASILNAITGFPVDDVLSALDEARTARIVVEVSDDTPRYRFTHVLFRDTLYEDLPRTKRVKLHSDLAVQLEELFAGDIESHLPLLAHHFCRAVPSIDGGRAAAYAARAGKAARDSLAYEEAVSYYARALDLSDPCAPDERCETLLALGEAQARAGDWLGARNTYATAGNWAKSLGSPEKFATAAAGFKGLIPGKNPPDQQAIAMLREALVLLGSEETVARARTLGELAKALYFSTEQGEAARCSVEAVAIARRLRDPVTLGNALEARIYTLWRPSDLFETLRVSSELIDVSCTSRDRELHFRGLMFRYSCLFELGDRVGSTRHLEDANALCQVLKNPRYRWQVTLALAAEAFCQGDYLGSSRLSEDALRLGSRVHDSSAEQYKVLSDFLLQRFSGKYASELEERLLTAVRCFPQIAIYQIGLAAIQHQTASTRTSLWGSFRPVVDNIPANALQLFSLCTLSDLCHTSKINEGAVLLYRMLLPYANHNIVVSWGAACDGSVSHYLGLLASALERWDDAVRHFEDALEMNGRMNFVPFVARTQHYYAATLFQRGQSDDRERAVGLLSAAITTYRRLGMQGYLRDALKVAANVPELAALCEAARDESCDDRVTHPEVPVEPNASPTIGLNRETSRDTAESPRENLFRREGEYWTVCYRGRVVRLKNMRGLEYIALLLGQPGKEVHALDLSALSHSGARTALIREGMGQPSKEDRLRVARLGDAGPVLDAKSRSHYRNRLGALGREVREAEQLNDVLKAAAGRREMEMLARELSAGTRRGGGSRLAGSYAERARINVRNNISAALRAIRRHDEELWRHLYRGVRTGTYCAYIPEAGVDWRL